MKTKTGVLLVNLGTPDSPSPQDVKRYLTEFLTDGRVIDLPYLKRQLLVRGVIIPKRYRESADAYSQIWTEEGSPLMVYTSRVRALLQKQLGESYLVEIAMRYQNPSIASALERLRKQSLKKIIILPLFPQYASATTGSIHQKVMELVKNWATVPNISFINSYYDHPCFIDALCDNAAAMGIPNYDHTIISFHGLPERQLKNNDIGNYCRQSKDCCKKMSPVNHGCYGAQCYATAHALASKLQMPSENYTVTFQSRLGKDPWVKPYTADTILEMGKKGIKKILVMCPAFTSDCLETIHEIGIELEEDFQKVGGQKLDLVPGLNDSPKWIQALAEIARS